MSLDDRRCFWLGLVLVTALAGLRLLLPGPQLLGSAGAEVYGHAWVQWWASLAWPALPAETGWVDPPRVTPWPVIDPLPTWLAAGLGLLIGRVAAFDALLLGGVALAWTGGWVLARRAGGEPVVGAVAISLAPIFGGSLGSGLTEDAGYGMVAIALALVGRQGWRPALAAGLALGSLAWLGLYLSLLGAIGAVVVGLFVLARSPGRIKELVLAALIAALLTLPAAARQGERLAGEGHRTGELRQDMPEPHWRVSPWRQADVASFVVPGPDIDDGALIRTHRVYLGFVALALALYAGRRAGRWWVLIGLGLALAPGPVFRLLGQSTGVPNPAAQAVAALPLGELVNHWGRLWLLGHLGLAAAASIGARRLEGRVVRWLPIAIGLEYVLLATGTWPLPVADASVPGIHRALDALPEGAVLVVPSAGPGVPFQRPMYRQRGHARALMIHPNQPGYGRASQVPLVRWLAALPGERKDPPDPEVARSYRELSRMGVSVLLVEEPWAEAAETLLGPPDAAADGGVAWIVASAP